MPNTTDDIRWKLLFRVLFYLLRYKFTSEHDRQRPVEGILLNDLAMQINPEDKRGWDERGWDA